MKDETTTYAHPSYGIIGFNRVQSSGHRRLFGSTLEHHYHTIRVRIGHAERYTSHGLDRFRSRTEIIEIEMSAAQFAEAITAMNVGDGVPCTISRITGQPPIEEPPDVPNEAAHAKLDFAERMKTFAGELAGLVSVVEKATEGKSLTQEGRKAIRGGIGRIVQEVTSNIPWFVTSYEEATERVSAAAKAEADAWLTAAIHRAGLGALRAQFGSGQTEAPALPPAGEDELR